MWLERSYAKNDDERMKEQGYGATEVGSAWGTDTPNTGGQDGGWGSVDPAPPVHLLEDPWNEREATNRRKMIYHGPPPPPTRAQDGSRTGKDAMLSLVGFRKASQRESIAKINEK